MIPINYYNPTRYIFARSCVKAQADLLASCGSKALIVTGKHSAKACGALDDVTEALTSRGCTYAIYDEARENPTIDSVRKGIALLREEKADFVIGIGGGSPMDTGKAIAFLAANEISDDQIFNKSLYKNPGLPTVMIPTTSGTGSEVTQYAILMNDAKHSKTSISTPMIFPKLALLDPTYTMSVGTRTTRNTAADALSHAAEGVLSQRGDSMITTVALEAIRAISACFPALEAETLGYEEREKLMYGSLLAGLVLAHTSTTTVHAMGYSLTYGNNIPHGRANGLLLPGYFRFVAKTHPDTVKSILDAMNMKSIDEFAAVFTALLGSAERLSDEVIEAYTNTVMTLPNIPNSLSVPTREDVIEMYHTLL